jgi:hypothetical protein
VSGEDLSDALSALIVHHLTSMDHVGLLLALRAHPNIVYTTTDLAGAEGLTVAVVDRALKDLQSARLIRSGGDGYRYDPAPELAPAMEELAVMYRTKPLTLVRSVYARPARAARSFAEAFRLRKKDE